MVMPYDFSWRKMFLSCKKKKLQSFREEGNIWITTRNYNFIGANLYAELDFVTYKAIFSTMKWKTYKQSFPFPSTDSHHPAKHAKINKNRLKYEYLTLHCKVLMHHYYYWSCPKCLLVSKRAQHKNYCLHSSHRPGIPTGQQKERANIIDTYFINLYQNVHKLMCGRLKQVPDRGCMNR